MATVIEVLKQAELRPEQLKELGLSAEWQQKLPLDFLETVGKLIEKNREALKELMKY
ncbi:MAG: hypothetical protein M1602_00290 [Firmicutes bacterium]|nr:hypothetical protein [Bacillota bacterium]